MTDLYPHRLADTSPWANPRSYAPDCGELLREHIRDGRCLYEARAGREWSRAVSRLRPTIAIASVALCIFCIAYFSWQFAR